MQVEASQDPIILPRGVAEPNIVELNVPLELSNVDFFAHFVFFHSSYLRLLLNNREDFFRCHLGFADIGSELVCLAAGNSSEVHAEYGNENVDRVFFIVFQEQSPEIEQR